MNERKQTDRLITAQLVEDTVSQVCDMSLEEVIGELKTSEPALVAGIRRFPQYAIAGIPEALSMQTRSQISHALWRAILVAYRCQRQGHYRLWAGTHLGTLLEQLDPSLREHAVRPSVPDDDDETPEAGDAVAGR